MDGALRIFDASKDLNNLLSGDYRVVVSGGGRSVTNIFTVREPSKLAVAATVCGSLPTVAISLTPSGGTPPYAVEWDAGGTELQKSVRFSGFTE